MKLTRRQGMKAGIVSLLAVFGIKVKTASGFDPSHILYHHGIHPAILSETNQEDQKESKPDRMTIEQAKQCVIEEYKLEESDINVQITADVNSNGFIKSGTLIKVALFLPQDLVPYYSVNIQLPMKDGNS